MSLQQIFPCPTSLHAVSATAIDERCPTAGKIYELALKSNSIVMTCLISFIWFITSPFISPS